MSQANVPVLYVGIATEAGKRMEGRLGFFAYRFVSTSGEEEIAVLASRYPLRIERTQDCYSAAIQHATGRYLSSGGPVRVVTDQQDFAGLACIEAGSLKRIIRLEAGSTEENADRLKVAGLREEAERQLEDALEYLGSRAARHQENEALGVWPTAKETVRKIIGRIAAE